MFKHITARLGHAQHCLRSIHFHHSSGMPRQAADQRYKWAMVTIVLTSLTLAGCANSLVIRTMYADLGNRMSATAQKYADFSDSQVDTIDHQAKAFHRWHRNTQLNNYADFLEQAANDLSSVDKVDAAQITKWINSVEESMLQLQTCHPLANAGNFLANLSDRQVTQVIKHWQRQQSKFEKKYNDETTELRIERRLKNITKWSGRLGIDFNAKQRALLQTTLEQQRSLGAERLQLRQDWTVRFTALLKSRKGEKFQQQYIELTNELWTLTEVAYPQQWAYNEQLWRNFAQQFINLQSANQRSATINKSREFVTILRKMAPSKSKPAITASCN